jgi:hypothetical protein
MAENDLWSAWPKSTNGNDEEIRKLLAAEYADHGAWARHYSTVRMTIGTFFVTAATGILYLRWDNPEPSTALLAALVLGVGAIVFLRFTWLTFKEMNNQRSIVASYRTVLLGNAEKAPKPLPRLGSWDGIYLCGMLVGCFVLLDGWWLTCK